MRGLRRTESGATIRTLPEYSKEAGDEEVVLVRYVYLFRRSLLARILVSSFLKGEH